MAVDVDRTLVDDSRSDEIDLITLTALSRLRMDRVPIVPVTGRPVFSALRIGRKVGAEHVVALGGAVVVRVQDGRPVWTADPIPAATVERIWDECGGVGIRMHLHSPDHWAVNYDDEETERYERRHSMPAPWVGLPRGDVSMIELINPERVPSLPGITAVTAPTSRGLYVDLTCDGIDKAAGLDRLCRLQGWDWDDVCAVGDGDNDTPMFRRAGRAVAVGRDPSSELLSVATHHCPLTAQEGAAGAAVLGVVYAVPEHLARVRSLR